MDLSAVIFVVLAIAWAGYLIPKALKHHDEVASSTLDEGHADQARVLARRRGATQGAPLEGTTPECAPAPSARVAEPALSRPRPTLTLAAARQAARRRRRVLCVLLAAVAVVAGLAMLGMIPAWATAAPGVLTVAFLVVARLSVRAQRRARAARPAAREAAVTQAVDAGVSTDAAAPAEDPAGILQQELEAALADDGSLWDPLPMNLPTYVGKARARRTVRTIELSGISSSGHDPLDTALVRQADEARRAAEAEQAEIDAEIEQRRVAGA